LRPAGRRLILEPLEDRTQPTGITFSQVLIPDLNTFLETTFIRRDEVAPISSFEANYFQDRVAGASAADLPKLDTILSNLSYISTHDEVFPLTVPLPLRTAIDSYFADKPVLRKAFNLSINTIGVEVHLMSPLGSFENALAGSTSLTPDQQPSITPEVPFSFIPALLEAIKSAEISFPGQPLILELAVPTDVSNFGQIQFVAPEKGTLLVAEEEEDFGTVLRSVGGGQSFSVNPSDIDFALVVPLSVHETTPALAASFLLQVITGPSFLNSTSLPESGLRAPGASLGIADTVNPSPNRSPGTVLLLDGGEARVGEGESRPWGLLVLPGEALPPARVPGNTREDDGDVTGETGERIPPKPLSGAPKTFAEPAAAAGQTGDAGSLLPLTPLKQDVPAAEQAPDRDAGEPLVPPQADPSVATKTAARLRLAAVDEAMKAICFTPGQDVPVVPVAALNPSAERTRPAVVDAAFSLAVSSLLWVPDRMSDGESRRRLLLTR
jgi:hypothetical protein